jgi:hypothetical protein
VAPHVPAAAVAELLLLVFAAAGFGLASAQSGWKDGFDRISMRLRLERFARWTFGLMIWVGAGKEVSQCDAGHSSLLECEIWIWSFVWSRVRVAAVAVLLSPASLRVPPHSVLHLFRRVVHWLVHDT